MSNQDLTQTQTPAQDAGARRAGAAAAGGRDRGCDRDHAVCRPARRAQGPPERARRGRDDLIEAEIVLPLAQGMQPSHTEVQRAHYQRAFTLSHELDPDKVSCRP